jgi:hypothetical protein
MPLPEATSSSRPNEPNRNRARDSKPSLEAHAVVCSDNAGSIECRGDLLLKRQSGLGRAAISVWDQH